MSRYTNIEAERAVIGILLFDDTAITKLNFTLEPRHFSIGLFEYIFHLIKEAQKVGQVADAITINGKIVDQNGDVLRAYEESGGMSFLGTLVDQAPMSANIASYAMEVLNNWKMRTLVNTFANSGGITDPGEMVAHIRATVNDVDSFEVEGDDFEDMQTIAARRIDQLNTWAIEGKTPGLQTGLKCFDKLGGLMPSTEWCIGARPGMGKTALLRSCLHGAATINPDHDFLFFSIEMSKEQGIDRALSAATRLTSEVMTKPEQYRVFKKPTLDMIRTLATIRGDLPTNVLVSGRGRLMIDDVRRAMSRLQARRKRPIGGVGIDYFQLMQFHLDRGDSLSSAMSKATRDLKTIAKEFGCAMILLSQLSRGVEARENKRPTLSDLKETSGLEQDADYVLFPFRPHYYEQKAGKLKTDVDDEDFAARLKKIEHDMIVGIAKARDDAGGDVMMFADMAFDVVRNVES